MIKAVDVSVNAFFPQFADRFSRFGYWKFFGSDWERQAAKGWSVESLLDSMEQAQVAMTGLVAFWASTPHNGEDCFVAAEELKSVLDAHPDKFFGLVGVNPLLPFQHTYYAPQYVRRAVKEFGFKAAHLALHWFGMSPDDKRLYPLYEACLELDIPVVIPLGVVAPRSGARLVAEPVLLDPVIGDFPQLRIVGQRAGFPWERESVYLARNNPNFSVVADWPSPQHWARDLIGFIKEGRFPKYDAGSDQVMWGSDFPLHDPGRSRQQLEQIGFSEAISTQLLRDNAVRVFKLRIAG